jgi:hypothetical protein
MTTAKINSVLMSGDYLECVWIIISLRVKHGEMESNFRAKGPSMSRNPPVSWIFFFACPKFLVAFCAELKSMRKLFSVIMARDHCIVNLIGDFGKEQIQFCFNE